MTSYDPEVLFQESKSSISSISKTVRFYFETEQDIFQTRGSVVSVENFVAGVYNQVATLYQNENIETQISEIFVWTTADPYTSNNLGTLLSQFQTHRTSFNGDLGQLLTFRSVGGGIAAGFNGLCNSNTAQRLSVAMLENNFSAVPNYSWSVQVITHELGHLFGSRHTHACVWNGNNTAIDGCGACQESPNPEDETCNNCTRPAIPSGGGTIMSYCHLQSVGINFNLGFGSQPGNVIRNSVNDANCLLFISGPTTVCGNQATYTIDGFDDLPEGTTVQWSASHSNLTLISGQGSGTATFMRVGYGINRIFARISINDNIITITSEQLTVGVPPAPATIQGIYNGQVFGSNGMYRFYVHSDDPNTVYQWTISGGEVIEGEGTSSVTVLTMNVTSEIPVYFNVNVRAGNDCGWSNVISRYGYVVGIDGPIYRVYPNPATDMVTVELQEVQPENRGVSSRRTVVPASTGPYEIELWSASAMLRRYTTDQPVYQIPVSGLPAGIYFVRVIKDGKTHTKKLIKK